ncbi:hypothetical protein ESA_02892 [Cronobacter sakazakii ATCC BAA-894]|uniref:Uncharacterized protein n=1 Tax=Cronobacter sakazakii (strain ATCC BAA-894) TaxID=290339 RepID=A7MLX4_CROS8|nr:hypothetical protein ESA_02892 [Cronobacter sakazakii ATCC BAA-894]
MGVDYRALLLRHRCTRTASSALFIPYRGEKKTAGLNLRFYKRKTLLRDYGRRDG